MFLSSCCKHKIELTWVDGSGWTSVKELKEVKTGVSTTMEELSAEATAAKTGTTVFTVDDIFAQS